MIKKIAKICAGILLVMIIAGTGAYLFFGDELVFYLQNSDWYNQKHTAQEDKELLRIAFYQAAESLDPTQFNYAARQHFVDIYEGLVKTDNNLNYQAGLALSWGIVRDNIWEFRLRPDVIFHNGKSLKAQDIVYSINIARSSAKSELKNILATIKNVKSVSDDILQVETDGPDPLLLNKLSLVLVVPDDYKDFNKPIGTGPYGFDSKDKNVINLKRFDDYWGSKPVYRNLQIISIPERQERIDALERGDVDILANVPPNVACSVMEKYNTSPECIMIENNDIIIDSIPGLEVSILMLNRNKGLFSDVKWRRIVGMIMEFKVFEDLAFGYVLPANQFVSNGVFGYSTDVVGPVYNMEQAKNEAEKILSDSFERPRFQFDYPVALEPVGLYVKEKFAEIGVDVILNPMEFSVLEQRIKSGDSEMYFFGWKSELGDASDFLDSVAHSRANGLGEFNGIGYSNLMVDEMIEKEKNTLDIGIRQKLLQDIMEIITDEDIIGIPLYESKTIYAYNKNIKFTPRIDGYVLGSEIK